MRLRFLASVGLALAGSTLAAGAASAAPAAAACNRACLEQVMDRYMRALTTHSPAGLPIAPDAEIREGTMRITPGQSPAWRKVVAVKARQDFADPVTGNVVSRSAVDMGDGKIGTLSVRLKVAGGRIHEIDTSFNQGTGPFDAENAVEPDVLWEAVVPPARRASRAEMIRIADAYFTAIGKHVAGDTPFSKRCDRYESGRKMTNDPTNPSNESGALTCAGTLTGLTGEDVEQRRYPLIDEEKGVILAYGFIQHMERPKPQATGLAEVFKIVDHKLRAIENIETVVSYPVEGGFGATGPK